MSDWTHGLLIAQIIADNPTRAIEVIADNLTQAKVDTIETLLRARDNSGKRRDLQRALHSLGRAACDTSTEETAIQATLDTIPEN